MPDDALTPRQVADELGVTVRTVQRWVADGRLPATRVGSRVRIARGSLPSVAEVQPSAAAAAPTRPRRRGPGRRIPGRLLIANRGEIVARIARTARRVGMEVVAIHAADDRPPGGVDLSLPIRDYLDADEVLAAARLSGADAVHPGYGFLSENPAFAQAVMRAGLTWVGPPPGAIAAMGDKAAARRTAARLGVPVLPGYEGEEQDDAALERRAQDIGLPVLVKATAGGGGKGMRVVRRADELADALAAARREAGRAFGDERLILERLLVGARHVEIQVLLDEAGNAVHLGERDCSAQRRNQKVIEEAPGPSVTPELRARMGEAAIAVAGAVGYVNAGTVEFLVDDAGAFYFLEMNTRLQVEHPVTEAVTGRDLVADQLRIAAGETLGFGQAEVRLAGHAMEARLYAEDPENGFLPAAGQLLRVRWPEGVRLEAGVLEGDVVRERYDPMLAKLIAHADDRDAAMQRLRAALQETELLGVRTNLRFLRWLLDQPVMRAGEVRTDSIASMVVPGPPALDEWTWIAAAAAARDAGTLPAGPWGGGWRLNATSEVRLRHGDEERSVGVPPKSPETPLARVAHDGTVHVDVEGRSTDFVLAPPPSVEDAVRHAAAHGTEHGILTAPMPGRIIAIRVVEGEAVRAHQPVLVLEAMKMEHAVLAPMDGRLTRLTVSEGQQVQRGEILAEVSA